MIAKIKKTLSKFKYRRIIERNVAHDRNIISELGLESCFDIDYGTSGVGAGDVSLLVRYIKEKKPQRVIEFGTGKSTWIIAQAMRMYCWDQYDGDIELISMEDQEEWFEKQNENFPKEKIMNSDSFVKIILSSLEIFQYKFAVGTSYRDTPLERFDFCFVDGPNPNNLSNMDLTFTDDPIKNNMCNMDFIKLLATTNMPMSCLIDGRRRTQIAFAALMGKRKMTRFHTGMCLFEGVTKEELGAHNYKEMFPENETILRF